MPIVCSYRHGGNPKKDELDFYILLNSGQKVPSLGCLCLLGLISCSKALKARAGREIAK